MPIASETVALLRQYADTYETADFIVGDPSWWMHQVEGNENQEATAFVASCLSYGSRQQFMKRIGCCWNVPTAIWTNGYVAAALSVTFTAAVTNVSTGSTPTTLSIIF